jgi:hypothetical protein
VPFATVPPGPLGLIGTFTLTDVPLNDDKPPLCPHAVVVPVPPAPTTTEYELPGETEILFV